MNTIKHIAFENVYVYNFMPTVLPKRRLMRPLALIQRLPLEDGCSVINFRSKVKVKLLTTIPSVVYSISYVPLLNGYQTCLTN